MPTVANPSVPADPELGRALAAARDGAIRCDLSALAVLRVSGDDAATFLHGQLTSDVGALEVQAGQLTAWCSPKGRVLANGLLWRESATQLLLLLPASLAAPVCKRLGLFVLRAKVKLEDTAFQYARVGLGGPAAPAAAAALFGDAPPQFAARSHRGATLIGLPGARFLLLCAAGDAPAWRNKLAPHAVTAPVAAWDWLDIRSGMPVVTAATQDLFIPQMLNWELLGGVSFSKGCYPGQEIVARSQYRGKLKERLYLAHLSAGTEPAPGDPLYSARFGEQSCGTLVNVAPAPKGGYDVLAVVQTAAASDAHWHHADGPALGVQPLPYTVPAA